MSDLPVYMSLDQLFEEWLDVPEHRDRFTDEGLACARDMIQETFGYLSVPEELFGMYIEDVFEKFREYDSLYTALEDPWLVEQDDPYLRECDIDEVFRDGDEIFIYADFKNYGPISHFLEEKGLEIKSFKFERIPLTMRELSPEEQEDVNGLLERLENDEDVVNVFHNMA